MADKSTSTSRTGIIIGAVGALVVLLLVAAVVFGNEEAGAEYGDPVITGTALTRYPNTESVDLSATGQVAPDVAGNDYAGAAVSITNDGKAKGIVFVAHWCPHCQAEVPGLVEQMAGGTTIAGTEVVGVATGTDENAPNYPPSAWLETEGWSAPVLADDVGGHISEAFGLSGFPYFVAVGADGTVVARSSGELTSDEVTALALAAQG